MSSRIFQSVIIQLKDATDKTIGVIDNKGYVCACSELSMIGSYLEELKEFPSDMGNQIYVFRNRTFRLLNGSSNGFEYAVFVSGTDDNSRSLCLLSSVSLNVAKANYEEKHDKLAFIKNIICDNILPGDVYVRAKELRFPSDTPRGVILVRQTGRTDMVVLECLQNMYPDKSKDFVLSISETDVVLVKELSDAENTKELMATADSLEKSLFKDYGIKTVIGVGTPAKHLRELADKYKEAQVAIDVGKVFEDDKTVINYENLGLGRIIYQLPSTLCEMFLSEVFKKNPIEALDPETLYTINKFFENNLNVSETSRKLFVHRNTLVYRLEKIKKLTGLDLREFDHAIVFKVALMVNKYLNSQKKSR